MKKWYSPCYELDKRIIRFEKDSLKFSGELKDSLMTYVFSLKQKRDEIKKKIESEFNETDESKWEVFKSNVKTVWNEVEIYANRIVKKLNENKEHY